MSKAIANPKLAAAAGILFTIATIFNVYAGATPAPAATKQILPTRTSITPGELPMCPPEGSCPYQVAAR
jgi:hypothetical protein